jgi:RNA polymerase sigma-70 factor (ECF subfamily)
MGFLNICNAGLNLSPLPCDYRIMKGKGAGTDAEGQLYDELLVMLVQSGDRRAAERLAARWHRRLARTARRLLQDDEMALAASQEAWLSILCGIAKLRDPARFAPWAFGILRRRCADALRSKQARPITAEAECCSPATQGETLTIRQAFASLPPDQRFAAQLYFVEGLTLAEIAEAQAVPIGTAKSRLFHARRKLKAVLRGEE